MGFVFGGTFVAAALVLSTIVFPFWNLIREDVHEEVIILNNDQGTCYVETKDVILKKFKNANYRQEIK